MASLETALQEYGCEYHHVQLFVDKLAPLAAYKELEATLNALSHQGSFDPFSGGMRFLEPSNALPERVLAGRASWERLCAARGLDVRAAEAFSAAGQDVVEQLLVGLGWRVTAEHHDAGTRSVLVTSQDARGVKFVVTAKAPASDQASAAAQAPSQTSSGSKQEQAQASSDSASEQPCGQPEYDHFAAEHVDRFLAKHAGFQGVSVLGFELPSDEALDATHARYEQLHPQLLLGLHEYEDTRRVTRRGVAQTVTLGRMRVLEAFAFYQGSSKTNAEGVAADKGTVLRFVVRSGSFGKREGFGNPQGVLPGLGDVPATFDGTSIAAYSDHWVSNVVDRHSFLRTLEDVLRFTPKVDFNAGVVAAGRAKIESTVTGNNTARQLLQSDPGAVLRDQSQVFLPINNSLSEVGHVHGFLEQLGQGIQHLASRVQDLASFIERVNNYRLITGRGFSFLNIPASYYGRLDVDRDLRPALAGFLAEARANADGGTVTDIEAAVAADVSRALVAAGVCSAAGIVRLDVTEADVRAALAAPADAGAGAGADAGTGAGAGACAGAGAGAGEAARLGELGDAAVARVAAAVGRARYSNLHALLRDHFDEAAYLQIVRNKILVDIQGSDVLFQIFTCNVLQRSADDEAPFLEFIQRVCSKKSLPDGSPAPIKPGCGGFGIRNFLTLFLSIEVSKAMQECDAAVGNGDAAAESAARRRVELLGKQLDESNPVLTKISDAMTAEGDALERAVAAAAASDESGAEKLREEAAAHAEVKLAGNAELQAISERYAALTATK